MDSEILLHVTRGALVESLHRGHIAVTDRTGRILHQAGNPCVMMFARSSMKPIQAIPVVESGAADAFGFTPEEIAILCASHSGEVQHTETVASMLSKLCMREDCLLCGPHAPFDAVSAAKLAYAKLQPTALHNNCSGKHAGMLALVRHLGAPAEGYMEPNHPVQVIMRQTVSRFTGVPLDELVLGTDGCGVPVFGLPLHRLAAAYAELGASSLEELPSSSGRAGARILEALRAHPFQLAGTGRYDTSLIEVTNGRIIGKMGAEGVFALTIPELGLGLALKIEDGTQRAVYPAVTEALMQLGLLTEEESSQLQEFHRPCLHNWKGTPVGEIRPVFRLSPSAKP